MKLLFSHRFLRSYQSAPASVQAAFEKQARLLVENLRHPSLRAKKYDLVAGIWQARVTRAWRFYFSIEGDAYLLHDIIPHPK